MAQCKKKLSHGARRWGLDHLKTDTLQFLSETHRHGSTSKSTIYRGAIWGAQQQTGRFEKGSASFQAVVVFLVAEGVFPWRRVVSSPTWSGYGVVGPPAPPKADAAWATCLCNK